MKKSALLIMLAIAALGTASPEAYAQGFSIDKNHLDKVKPYQAPRQIDIIDNRPIVHNHLTPEQQPDYLQINTAFPAPIPGKCIPVQVGDPGAPQSAYRADNPNLNSTHGLAPAGSMFQTNIAPRAPLSRLLPPGNSVGVHTPANAPQLAERKAVSARLDKGHKDTPIIARGYTPYTEAGTSSNSNVIHADVIGKLKSPLRSRLLGQ